jgi:ABC-type nitrate/sulfonate/bicarbonate transport system substrate-binding protein
LPQPFHKLELRRMLERGGIKPDDIFRIYSAGDSTTGFQEVLFTTTKGKAMRALIDRPTIKDKAKVHLIAGWDL